jgi:hypothetical protein
MERNDVSTLFLAGGLSLIAMGIGLIMAHPDLRRSLIPLAATLPGLIPGIEREKLEELGKLTDGGTPPLKMVIDLLLPDIERYLKARAM